MRNRIYLISFLIVFGSCQNRERIDFNTQIKTIINDKCISCHGGVKKTAGFSLLFEEEAFSNTEEGSPAIIPGNAAKSRMIQRFHEKDPELRMPYEKPPLSKEEIELFSKWIDQGAEWGTHWAYIPPKDQDVPAVEGLYQEFASSKNPIDHFIASRMLEKEVEPNPIAEKNILARRVALDLTGLPPEETLYTLYHQNQISYEAFVDSLLSKEGYGEKWASWWLDLARYSDTKGYEADRGRSIWQYRDWVIKTLNKNIPFDQFTMEQLAGDLLPNPNYEQLLATAFHRNTMNNDEGGTNDEEYRTAAVIDRVNTTFDVWQSTTMSCVQCHDHPYDPIRQKEYYQVMAFFNNTRDEDLMDESPNLRSYGQEIEDKIEKVLTFLTKNSEAKTVKVYNDFFTYLEPKYQAHNSIVVDAEKGFLSGVSLHLRNKGTAFFKGINTQNFETMYFKHDGGKAGTQLIFRKNAPNGEILGTYLFDNQNRKLPKGKKNRYSYLKIKKQQDPFDLYVEAKTLNPRNGGNDRNAIIAQMDWIAFLPDLNFETKQEEYALEEEILNILNSPKTLTPIMVENPDFMFRKTQLFDRGSWLIKKEEVAPGVPGVLNDWLGEWEKNRLGFSKWIISKENPLTSRTIVNRIWYQIFGRGLVTTLEDLGTQSEPPSHPALLDWLAFNFMHEMNWDLKALIKQIVLSSTYKQSSKMSQDKLDKDPKNVFYAWGPKLRLTAEEIRDQALFVSELLSSKKYGPGVMPPQPDGIWEHAYLGNLWKESIGEDKYRRAIYTYLKRTSPYPSFISFDAGSREVCMIRRIPSNTPLQALVTMNDPVYLEAAMALAKNNKADTVEDSIKKMYQKATFSSIETAVLQELLRLYEITKEEFEKNKTALDDFFGLGETPDATTASLSVVANAIMNLDEFLTHG